MAPDKLEPFGYLAEHAAQPGRGEDDLPILKESALLSSLGTETQRPNE